MSTSNYSGDLKLCVLEGTWFDFIVSDMACALNFRCISLTLHLLEVGHQSNADDRVGLGQPRHRLIVIFDQISGLH